MKLLLIEDDDDIRRVARLSLGRLGGMDVIEAGGGAEGLRRAAEHQPDAILLDALMPVMDGPATLAALRADPRTAAIPVVFLTGKTQLDDLSHLRGLGAAGVLTKPFDPLALPIQVRAALGRA
jgi:CheY-like chemotaxis protein